MEGAIEGKTSDLGGNHRPIGPDAVGRVDLVDGEHTIVIFDLETTGLHQKEDRVIQLAAKVVRSGGLDRIFSALVDPEGKYLSYKIRELTGITPQILAANNARPFNEVWPQFASWLTSVGTSWDEPRGIVLAAHNARFDHKFLMEEIARAGFSRSTLAELGVVLIVDTLAVLRDKSMWRGSDADTDLLPRPRSFKLGELFKYLHGREEMPGAHTALGDVRGLERVLSAPSINQRWRLIASANLACQIPVPQCEAAGLDAQKRDAPSSVVASAAPAKRTSGKNPRGAKDGKAESAQVERSRMRAREWAREQQAKKKAQAAQKKG